MKWHENIRMTRLWLNRTGTANTTLYIDRVGPLFKVYNDKLLPGLAEGKQLNPLWYFRYATAKREYDRRCLIVQEDMYGD